MTLFRQIFVLVSVLFLVLLLTLEWTYVRHSREYLQDQLTSHAQDVATSLGMVLPPSLAAHDQIRLETTVGAVFDRGFYRAIRVIDLSGHTLLLRQLPPAPPEVPGWFVAAVPLTAPSAQSLITNGWRQLGRVVVTSHPNFAYLQLWATTRAATFWCTVFYLVCLLLLWFFLRTILRPLAEIEGAAEAIGERRFVTIDSLPQARELRRTVEAINTLSGKIQEVIGHEVQSAAHYRHEAQTDALTGLPNRRSFTLAAESWLIARPEADLVLFLIQVEGLEGFNARGGYAAGDALLAALSAGLAGFEAGADALKGRLGGSGFGLLAWSADVSSLGERLAGALTPLCLERDGVRLLIGAVTARAGGTVVSELLGEADAALQRSRQDGSVLVTVPHDPEGLERQGALHWKGLIEAALGAHRVSLWRQTVYSLEGARDRVLQQEVTVSLTDGDGNALAAARFIPQAQRFGLMAALDRGLIEAVLARLADAPPLGTLALNLAVQSLADEALMTHLFERLAAVPAVARHLVFEFPEFEVIQDRARVNEAAATLRRLGAEIAVDHFGFHGSALQYLQQLRPVYVKLSAAYLQDLESHPENQFFIASVVRVARPLEILTLACGVESALRLDLLASLGVAGYQGYAGSAPQPW